MLLFNLIPLFLMPDCLVFKNIKCYYSIINGTVAYNISVNLKTSNVTIQFSSVYHSSVSFPYLKTSNVTIQYAIRDVFR